MVNDTRLNDIQLKHIQDMKTLDSIVKRFLIYAFNTNNIEMFDGLSKAYFLPRLSDEAKTRGLDVLRNQLLKKIAAT